jgi:hypothetical protein
VRDSSQVQVHLDPEVFSRASLVDKDTVWTLQVRRLPLINIKDVATQLLLSWTADPLHGSVPDAVR